jgi:hypothetical protein
VTKNPIECYQNRKSLESLDELEELRKLSIKETEGNKEIQNTIPSQTDNSYNHSLKLQRLNIGTVEKPKIDLVGNYWDDRVPLVLCSYRKTTKKLHRYTPFQLVYEKEAVVPIEFITPSLYIA